MNLQDIQQVLEADGFTTSFEKATPPTSLDRLLVLLNQEKSLYLELIFIPTQDEIEDIRLLQVFVGLPYDFTDTTKAALRELFLNLNVKLPLGGFGLKEDESLLYFRYVAAISSEEQSRDSSVILQVVWVVYYLVEQLAASVQAVAAGQKTPAQVLS